MAETIRNLPTSGATTVAQEERNNKMIIKKQIDDFNQKITRKAVIRYLTIVVDFSADSLKQDMRPNRAIVMKDQLSVSSPPTEITVTL